MLNFLLLMLFPLIIALVTLLVFKGKVLFWEFAAQVGVVALFVAVALGIAYESRTSDTEVWNGQVTSKKRNEVSCRHSYSCNCHEDCSGSGSNRSCTEHCDTCYEHSYDVDVVIGSSDGNGDKIDFADVMSWSTNKTLAVDLRDRIQTEGSLLQKDAIVRDIGESVDKNFVRMHMKDMKWLMRSFQPSQTAMIVIFILATLISIGLSIWAVFADLGEDDLGEDSYGHRRFAARIKYSRYGGY